MNRSSIFSERARVVGQQAFDAGQYVLKLHAPRCAAAAAPGQFMHLRCAGDLPLRRPYSILSADAGSGEVEMLYKIVGAGSRRLAACCAGDVLDSLGPIGRAFAPSPERPNLLLVGGGVGIPPVLFLAARAHEDAAANYTPRVLMGSEIPFPFDVTDSALPFAGVGDEARATMAALEQRGIAARLASGRGFANCYRGPVGDLARQWLDAAPPDELAATALFACGPLPMLQHIARIAAHFNLPCQVALEETMACGVGGCAGCTVAVRDDNGGIAMKRVCVDGPVFDARRVFG
ncbi:MAG: dihydroorotate dehydrogenase electron transfer subunit, partial [Gammaproteobacteria bacterium]|nr:dihydroorotate dehydrogenase electron transfer subunit [Gammaproteobacteria bacterium]